GALRGEAPEEVGVVAVVNRVAVDDEVLPAAGRDDVFQRDVGHGLFSERPADEEVTVALDIVDGHPAVAQLAEAGEDPLHRGGGELRIGDEVVKEVAVEVEGLRLELYEAVEPGQDRH